jgi:DsbC/DsbD-like thiol-disulfide interchange protein
MRAATRSLAVIVLATIASAGVAQQQPGDLSGAGAARAKSYVVYAAEPQSVPAGKKTVLELRFRVNEGFHVNSHTPKSELLIPTKLTFEPAAGVKAGEVEYPAGSEYSFASSPGEKLDVYTGTFSLKLPVQAAAGEHTVAGVLRYQACDHAACYPPKSLPVSVLFTAK